MARARRTFSISAANGASSSLSLEARRLRSRPFDCAPILVKQAAPVRAGPARQEAASARDPRPQPDSAFTRVNKSSEVGRHLWGLPEELPVHKLREQAPRRSVDRNHALSASGHGGTPCARLQTAKAWPDEMRHDTAPAQDRAQAGAHRLDHLPRVLAADSVQVRARLVVLDQVLVIAAAGRGCHAQLGKPI